MAAYAATVTIAGEHSQRLVPGMRIVRGTVDVTNYNTTGAETTNITKHFKGGAPTVILGGVSDNGFLVAWDTTDKCVHAWYPTIASDQTPTADIVAAAGTEVASDVDVGAVPFVAFGPS